MRENPQDVLVRIGKIVGPNGIIPISRSSFYQGIRDGIYPKPVRLGKRSSAWRMSELLGVINQPTVLCEDVSPLNLNAALHNKGGDQ